MAGSESVDEILERLTDREATFGVGDLRVAATRVLLACALAEAGDLPMAVQEMRSALDVRVEQLGDEAVDTILARRILGGFLGQSGDWLGAADQFEAAACAKASVYGAGAESTLATRVNLGVALANAGSGKRAIEELSAVREISKHSIQLDSPVRRACQIAIDHVNASEA